MTDFIFPCRIVNYRVCLPDKSRQQLLESAGTFALAKRCALLSGCKCEPAFPYRRARYLAAFRLSITFRMMRQSEA
jgi:hypothetical protein